MIQAFKPMRRASYALLIAVAGGGGPEDLPKHHAKKHKIDGWNMLKDHGYHGMMGL